jgi:D-amino-acid dehydrogenase
MRVVVVGAGVIGVTSAWYLTEAGHEVTVIDRLPGPADETSFANAGQVSPGYSAPWAGPSIPTKAIKWLLMRHPPLILQPRIDPAMIRWCLAMLRNCTAGRYARNKARMVGLAEYSRDCMDELRAATGIAYDGRQQGTLQLFRKQSDLDAVGKDVSVLRAAGVDCEVLDPAGCIAAEPGLAKSEAPFVGGLRLPHDQTGDCRIFTQTLAAMCEARGVRVLFDTPVNGLQSEGGRITAAITPAGPIAGDAFVAATGCWSPALLKPLGLDLPVYPVKGYSITAPIIDADRAPVSTVMDESYKIAITRLGDRIRVGGMAELAGFDKTLHPARRDTLEYSVGALFPGAGDLKAATFWSGLRPMTPDGTPVIGATKYDNLYLNTGHGTLGWTMACGSGRVLADLIDGNSPDIDTADLSIARYASGAAS